MWVNDISKYKNTYKSSLNFNCIYVDFFKKKYYNFLQLFV